MKKKPSQLNLNYPQKKTTRIITLLQEIYYEVPVISTTREILASRVIKITPFVVMTSLIDDVF